MDLGSAWVQSTAMLSDEIITVVSIPIMEWRVLSKRKVLQPKTADDVCPGCSKPRQILQVYKLNADIEENKFLSRLS